MGIYPGGNEKLRVKGVYYDEKKEDCGTHGGS